MTPIILGGVATWPLLAHQDNYKWVTGICALRAGLRDFCEVFVQALKARAGR
jgi:hypothetical protein